MEIRVKRFSTPYDQSIISHADRKNHKYVAKVKVSNGRYRYFYTKEAYQQYLNENKGAAKDSNEGIGDKIDKWIDKFNSKRIKLIMSKYPNHDVGQVTETDDYFVINIVPKNSKTDAAETEYEPIKPALCDNSLKAVNKITKSIFTYNPIKHG